jgi:hypothetical protein
VKEGLSVGEAGEVRERKRRILYNAVVESSDDEGRITSVRLFSSNERAKAYVRSQGKRKKSARFLVLRTNLRDGAQAGGENEDPLWIGLMSDGPVPKTLSVFSSEVNAATHEIRLRQTNVKSTAKGITSVASWPCVVDDDGDPLPPGES